MASETPARPGKVIRLGAYLYAGRLDPEWIAANFDLIDLNAKNDAALISRLKQANPRILVFQQFLMNQLATRQTGAQAVEGFDPTRMSQWLMRRVGGEPKVSHRGPNYLLMDISRQSGWAEVFAHYTRNVLSDTGADGLVLDEVPLRKTGDFEDVRGYPDDESLQDATHAFLVKVRRLIGKPIMINVGALAAKRHDGKVLWDVMSDAIDGAWHEGWIRFYGFPDSPHSDSDWESDIHSAEQFSLAGKPYIASVEYSNQLELEYAIASYLLAARGSSLVFQPMYRYDPVTRGGFNAEIVKRDVEAYRPLFDINIGCPIGTRYLEQGIWQRRFARGLVLVNPTPHEKRVHLSDRYVAWDGRQLEPTFTVQPFSARIMLLPGHESIN